MDVSIFFVDNNDLAGYVMQGHNFSDEVCNEFIDFYNKKKMSIENLNFVGLCYKYLEIDSKQDSKQYSWLDVTYKRTYAKDSRELINGDQIDEKKSFLEKISDLKIADVAYIFCDYSLNDHSGVDKEINVFAVVKAFCDKTKELNKNVTIHFVLYTAHQTFDFPEVFENLCKIKRENESNINIIQDLLLFFIQRPYENIFNLKDYLICHEDKFFKKNALNENA